MTLNHIKFSEHQMLKFLFFLVPLFVANQTLMTQFHKLLFLSSQLKLLGGNREKYFYAATTHRCAFSSGIPSHPKWELGP